MSNEQLLATIDQKNEVIAQQASQIAKLSEVNDQQAMEKDELTRQLKMALAQLEWFKRQMFGRKSEKNIVLEGMPSLFTQEELAALETVPEAQATAEETSSEESAQKPRANRKPTSRVRQTWENLPVLEREVIEPDGVDFTRYRHMGEEVTYQVCFRPGMLYRKAIVRPKYGLIDPTEPVEKGQGVMIAPLPLLPIYKGIPDASLLAETLLQKYEYHMPFYRQIKKFAHLGMMGLKEATLVGWFKRTMELLKPLYKALEVEVFKSDYVQTDETVMPVINHESGQADQEYLWMSRAVIQGLVLFYYNLGSRSGDVVKKKADANNFRGYMQCDGFKGYPAAFQLDGDVCLVNCLVHIRRAFEGALKENREPATWFLVKIRELYHIEHQCDAAEMDYDQRKAVRQEKSKPIMDEMKKWLETEGIKYSQSSLIGNAVTYAYTRWENMEHVLEDGRIFLDNNLAENEIRSITIGRKNYLFCGNHEAVNNMCVVISLLATCRNHNVNPRPYLIDVIKKMPYYERAPHEKLVELLPHKWIEEHPEARLPDIRQLAKGKSNSL